MAGSEQVRIERMAYGSDAVGHLASGKTVFVRGGVPGDTVEVILDEDGPRFARGHVGTLLEASPERVEPACPYADVCGGCPWAHLSRRAQLDAKRTSVVDSLQRIGHFSAERSQELTASCLAPSDGWGYRNKIELAFARDKHGVRVGMHAAQGSQIIKLSSCPLLDSRYAKLAKSAAGALSYLAGSRDLSLERIGIRASSRTGEVEIALWTSPGAFPRAQAAKLLQEATKASSVVRVLSKGPAKARRVSKVECLSGAGCWHEKVAGSTMALSAPSFFQVNTKGADKLVELALAGLDPASDDEAMDLYCGAGTFTLPLARHARFVSAVESYGPAVRDLRRNVERAHLDNVEAIGGDAGREFPDTDADIIVVDPPRAGLAADVVEKLSLQPARAIAYVSCDPATLARDLARFETLGTFKVNSLTPVDLFPQTFHVETCCLMSRVKD